MAARPPQAQRRRRRGSQIRRVVLAVSVTIAMSFVALIHFRVGVPHLYPLATQDVAGPFSHVVVTLEFIVPIAIAGITLATWGWVLVGPVQQERTVRRGP